MKRRTETRKSLNMKRRRRRTYLPDECWEVVFKHLAMDDDDYNSLSLVSQQFLSITDRLRSTLTIKSNDPTIDQVLTLIARFPNLTSLNFCNRLDVDSILPHLVGFLSKLTSLKISDVPTIPATGLINVQGCCYSKQI
jgi:hypothetical protein